jgi:hypothetical protein
MIILLKLTTSAKEHLRSYGIIVDTYHALMVDG